MNVSIKVGKLKEFNGTKGIIIDSTKEYWFLDTDLIDLNVKVGDLVVFRDECCLGGRVFFVSKATKKNNME